MPASESSLKRAVLLMTGSSFLVPAAGLVTAPILAQALSTDGRGELSAALAPATLMLAAATLGLPEALTYLTARRPGDTRLALALCSLLTLAVGVACVAAVWSVRGFLSGGDPGLAWAIVVAALISVPALVVNVLRGAAAGHQHWGLIAVERMVLTAVRLLAFVVLFVTGQLTVYAAIVVYVTTPLLAGVVYLPLLAGRRRPGDVEPGDEARGPRGVMRPLLSFGARAWFGSVASMLLSRVSQLFMVPLSSVQDLGLYSVAITVADVPLIVALAIQGAIFGAGSKTRDAARVTATSRQALLVGFLGCATLAAILPLMLPVLFGPEFRDALVPCLVLLAGVVMSIPGLMASSALVAWGRPGLRSTGLLLTLVVNLAAFFLLVPRLGVDGACLAGLLTQLVMSLFMLRCVRGVVGVPGRDFWWLRRSDLDRTWRESVHLVRRLPLLRDAA